MRRLVFSTVAAVTLVGGSLFGTYANAMPAAGGLTASTALPVGQVRLVCERVWNGHRWARSCYETGPRYYDGGAGYGYGAPGFYFGGGGFGHHHHHHHGHHHHGGHHGGGHHGGGHHHH
ncbi:hypothetical protein [Bradyrhizobium prioriisuperbiae]|uniref:hypothetical protein n=1 Tax=Bradyrhizobium prioriisuperbiae TaxID=2854389 RepID=UPI0028E4C228|nr:hypothetical protein [Bradyrhizobium prioritasuperba]